MEVQPLIQKRTEACRDLFRKFTTAYPSDECIEDRQADFELWSAGLRASASGKASLDYRVKDHPKTRDMICDYLDGIDQLLQRHLVTPKQDSGLGDDDEDDDSSDDADLFDPRSDIFNETRTAVKSILHGLARISSSIRRAGTKFRFKAADDGFDENRFSDAKRMYTLHIYREQGKSRQRARDQKDDSDKRTGPSTKEACDNALAGKWMTSVQTRLVKANLYRHNRMLYSSQAMRNLPMAMVAVKPPPSSTPKPGKHLHTPLNNRSTLVDDRSTSNSKGASVSESGETHTPSMGRTATDIGSQYDENVALKEQTPSLFTQGTRTGISLQYPSCPQPETGGLRWCPYCGDILSEDYCTNKSRWRGHVAHDLLPYSCVTEDCSQHDEMYGTKAELLDHMHKHHSVKRWTCQHCNSSSKATTLLLFESDDEWKAHMLQIHNGAFRPEQLPRYSKLAERIMVPDMLCPMCQSPDENVLSDLEHIAQCLHHFALLALPPGPNHGHKTGSSKSSSHRAVQVDDNSLSSREALMMGEESINEAYLHNNRAEFIDEETQRALQNPGVKLNSNALVSIPASSASDRLNTWKGRISQESPTEVVAEDKTDNMSTVPPEILRVPTPTPSDAGSSSSSDIEFSFFDKLMSEFTESAFDKRSFLPEHCMEQLLTYDAIVQQLGFRDLSNSWERQELVGFILREAKKVFSICILSGFTVKDLAKAMRQFRQIGFNDSSLPVTDEVVSNIPFFGLQGSPPLPPWGRLTVYKFRDMQWSFLVPVFSWNEYAFELQPRHILPFISMIGKPWRTSFGEVHQVEVHPSHMNYPNLTNAPSDNIRVAFKSLYRPSSDDSDVLLEEREWQRNALAHREIASLQHPNIVRFMAAITRGKHRYMMYEWADGGDLRTFWKNNPRPDLTPHFVQDVVEQLRCLADALVELHNYRGGSYRHGDLKPENILRFTTQQQNKSRTDVGTFKLSGLGLAKRHVLATQVRGGPTSTRWATMRYQPPEAATTFNQGRSRRYDIWSMGCIILEFLIWILYGNEGLNAFESNLVGNFGEPSAYYIIESVQSGRKAKLHPRIIESMDIITSDLRCGQETALEDLLGLVQAKLLVVDLNPPYAVDPILKGSTSAEGPVIVINETPSANLGTYRASAEDLRAGLDTILGKGKDDQLYWLTGQRRDGKRLSFTEKHQRTIEQPGRLLRPSSVRRFDIPKEKLPPTVASPLQETDNSVPVPEESLRDELYSALVRPSQGTGEFLPVDVLKSLITESRVQQELTSSLSHHGDIDKTELARKICDGEASEASQDSYVREKRPRTYRKVFAILIMIEKTADIVSFVEGELSDLDLPLIKVARAQSSSFDLRRQRNPEATLRCFSGWTQLAIRDFEERQWSMLAPFFSRSTKPNDVFHYRLRNETILPFVQQDGGEQEAIGGFGSVSKVSIHPSHHNFMDDKQPYQMPFAVKKLQSSSKEDFQSEVDMLRKFSGQRHQHLISLLGTYEQSGKYSLIFPWAEADLLGYWKKINPNPRFDKETVLWVADQCRGIANGVTTIHQYYASAAGSTTVVRGFHGDIKPSNVLWFPGPNKNQTIGGELKISDFGQAGFQTEADTAKNPDRLHAVSPSYRPPEYDLKQAVGTAFDMWTLGCLYLEFITWLLGGWSLVDSFSTQRLAPDAKWGGIEVDTFFQLVNKDDGEQSAIVKPTVTNFFTDLHAHPRCSEFVHDFLNIIQDDMLVVISNSQQDRTRISSRELNSRLAMIVKRCHEQTSYACAGSPWPHRNREDGEVSDITPVKE